jgi:cysteine desulfurase
MPGQSIYLDYAAATPLDERVLAAMQPYLAADFYNPSATYQAARDVRAALEAARSKVAHWLGARGSEIIFTAGGTEANNLAIHGVMRRFPDANVVTSAIEHESVIAPAGKYGDREAGVGPDGRIDMESLRITIDDETVLVSIMYANNEIGAVQPIHEVGQLITAIRQQRRAAGNELPLYFHTDGAQAANYLDIHVARLGVDLMTLNGGKIYGPKQSGCLYVKAGVALDSLIDGGGQERGLRSGTENVAAAIGFAKALDIAQAMRRDETARLQVLQKRFIDGIEKSLPASIINGSRKYRLPNNVHLTVPGQDNERLLIQLDEAGIMAAAGSACSASSEESSHVLHALDLDDNAARASLRFTMGRATQSADVERALEALAQAVKK